MKPPVKIDGHVSTSGQPTEAELVLDTSSRPVTEATEAIERMLAKTGVLFDELTDLAANI